MNAGKKRGRSENQTMHTETIRSEYGRGELSEDKHELENVTGTFDCLPPELLVHIFSFTYARSRFLALATVGSVCKLW